MNIESSADHHRNKEREKEDKGYSSAKKTQAGVKSIAKSFKDGFLTTFEPSLESEYQKIKKDLINYIVFFEFLKEFITTFSHKHRFENLVEDIYGLYSNLLDDDYYNDMNKESQ